VDKVKEDESDTPNPKWWIVSLLNVLLTAFFLFSAFLFFSDSPYSHYAPLVWSACIAYFLGFFGISFIDTKELKHSPSTYGLADLVGNNKNKGRDGARTSNVDIHPVCPIPISPSSPNLRSKLPTSNIEGAEGNTTIIRSLSDPEIAGMVNGGKIKDHMLEKTLGDHLRAVKVRRMVFEEKLPPSSLSDLPSSPSLDYSKVFGANCEIVVGYVPIPVGMCGPLGLNGEKVFIPMATTEGCLVASTNRGCKAITMSGGANSYLLKDGITRAPCLECTSAGEASKLSTFVLSSEGFEELRKAFESTTSFGKLKEATPTVAGKNVYLRLKCFAGDAMGMNMVSKGTLAAVAVLTAKFPSVKLVALSGNMCTDKKASAVNWLEGRGKSVVIESVIHSSVVSAVLKTTVDAIVHVNTQKNLIGSAMSSAVGGFNAHAANNVTAVFLATGQDPAQNVESSNCITLMEKNSNGDLHMTCTMPSIEVGTVGGGTSLPAQSACLKAIGVKGGGVTPGANAQKLAHVVAGAVMAGELSLLAALAANTLVQAHMTHNRKPQK